MNEIMAYYKKKKTKDSGAFDDVNGDLFVALFAIDTYGSIAYEENVLELIINKTDAERDIVERQKRLFEERVKSKEYKLDKKSGYYLDKNGCFVLKRS